MPITLSWVGFNHSRADSLNLLFWTLVMIHYSCDRCKRPIPVQECIRYVVKMEIEAAIGDGSNECPDADLDCLSEMDEILENMEDDLLDEDLSIVHQRRQYDLCPNCYREFIKNPVGREKLVPFGFSKN